MPLKRSLTNAKRNVGRPIRGSHTRSYSFSSVNEHTSGAALSSALKIVIDRSPVINQEPTPDETILPSLQIPIPHYRLGTPRFSAHGTPMLRSSAYTASSAVITDTNRTSNTTQREFVFPAPPGPTEGPAMRLDYPPGSRNSDVLTPHSSLPASYLRMSQSEQVDPAIFDIISTYKNDPSLVRFAHQTQSIIAATPARIVAQISSESFLDYDLVSDFFLTFRSYMSTMELVNLLLARLRWAIGRLEEDGRIIRIRTFAAIRHWILNYFLDDYVPNRDLRVQFCELLNDMYNEVRSKSTTSKSDVKVLQDLKRCWNGRCSLYWESPFFAADTNLDRDIIPGGAAEIQGEEEPDLRFEQSPDLAPRSMDVKLSASHVTSLSQRQQQQVQNVQTPSGPRVEIAAILPGSPGSDVGLQPNSCSFPLSVSLWPQTSKWPSTGHKSISVQLRRQKAPSNLAVQTKGATGPRSSIQSLDSDREQTPTALSVSEPVKSFEGSLIRGQVFPPASPIVQVLSSETFAHHSQFGLYSIAQTNGKTTPSGNSSTRNILGSIRRALGAKSSSQETISETAYDNQRNDMGKVRLWTNPLSGTRSSDELRKRLETRPVKTHLRVDLLCAAVAETFEAVRSAASDEAIAKNASRTVINKHNSVPKPPNARYLSQATAQSGSILIVDDTGLGIPAHLGTIVTGLNAEAENTGVTSHNRSKSFDRPRTPSAISAQHRAAAKKTSFASQSQTRHKPSWKSLQKSQSSYLVEETATSVADVGLVASEVSEGAAGPGPSIDAQTEVDDDHESPLKIPGQTLRRRPGGNLKENHHVQDLQTYQNFENTRREADNESLTESLVIMSNRESEVTPMGPPPEKRISMIHTHSSQHLRPSFEAAVAGFSSIPDDVDGGLEATLLKLEGKYEGTPVLESEAENEVQTPRGQSFEDDPQSSEKKQHRHQHVQEDAHAQFQDLDPEYGQGSPRVNGQKPPQGLGLIGLRGSSYQSAESREQVPLLERGLQAESSHDRNEIDALNERPMHLRASPDSHSSIEIVDKTTSMEDLRLPSHDQRGIQSTSSFLLDENEDLSDLSSDISVDIINQADITDRSFSPMVAAPGTARSGLELPSHPLRHTSEVPSPVRPVDIPSQILANAITRMPLTPEDSPVQGSTQRDNEGFKGFFVRPTPIPTTPSPAHIPFILACDSQTIAQQLTLIEREALNEVDWLDLVEMRWDNKSVDVRDWAEYLSTTRHAGVDLVVTRFNIMVKWAVSEIVLTQNIHERARTISKYIHVAAHARRLHNYATMLQITIALISGDCARLVKTWELVSPEDRMLLKSMEALVQPVRNFHDLRAEMESSDLSDGCVPFIGQTCQPSPSFFVYRILNPRTR